jgi:hypothetical protein
LYSQEVLKSQGGLLKGLKQQQLIGNFRGIINYWLNIRLLVQFIKIPLLLFRRM